MSKNISASKIKKLALRHAGPTLKEQQAQLLAFCAGDYTVTRPAEESKSQRRTQARQHSQSRPR
jgi:hypothetical protein